MSYSTKLFIPFRLVELPPIGAGGSPQ